MTRLKLLTEADLYRNNTFDVPSVGSVITIQILEVQERFQMVQYIDSQNSIQRWANKTNLIQFINQRFGGMIQHETTK